jgi:hypothetical protein
VPRATFSANPKTGTGPIYLSSLRASAPLREENLLFQRKMRISRGGAEKFKCRAVENRDLGFLPCFAKARSYISRREVKVFGVEIFLYEWALIAKILGDREISKTKIIYFFKRPRFCVC